MPSGFIKRMKGMVKDNVTAEGLLYNDWDVVSPCQEECTGRLAYTIQLEEEAYMTRHPEVMALLTIFLSKVIRRKQRKNILEQAGYHFTRPFEVLDEEVRQLLKSPPEGPYSLTEFRDCGFEITDLEADLLAIVLKYYPLLPMQPPISEPETPFTVSSSFISLLSSVTTLPTPEPIPTPEPTISEIMFKLVVNSMDKATASKLTDEIIKYDTAYVEVMKAVEEAMEIPVIEIRQDIAELLDTAYSMFDEILNERARIAAEIAWDRRMRKKLKRTLRRQKNFKGYETPPTPTSDLPSSHESYRIPPLRPCKCHPQWTYNRYPKDRFGIYMPKDVDFPLTSITLTPAMSAINLANTNTDTTTQK